MVRGTGTPFAEDFWRKLKIGGSVEHQRTHTRVKMLLPHLLTSAHAYRVEFHVAQPCDRCMLPRVDPVLGELGKHEPTRTLTTFRTRNGKQYFGQYLLHTSYTGTRHSNSSIMG